MHLRKASWSMEDVISKMIQIVHVILQNVCVPFRASEDLVNVPDRPPRWNLS